MSLSIIVSVSSNNVIGKDGTIPWLIHEDLIWFRTMTLHHRCIMGIKTFKSLPVILDSRQLIVLSKNTDIDNFYNIVKSKNNPSKNNEILLKRDIHLIEKMAPYNNKNKSFIIGGGEIYKEFISLCDEMFITKVRLEVEGDTYFPKLNSSKWNLIEDREGSQSTKKLPYSFQHYIRV